MILSKVKEVSINDDGFAYVDGKSVKFDPLFLFSTAKLSQSYGFDVKRFIVDRENEPDDEKIERTIVESLKKDGIAKSMSVYRSYQGTTINGVSLVRVSDDNDITIFSNGRIKADNFNIVKDLLQRVYERIFV